jgi:hypothetical protein
MTQPKNPNHPVYKLIDEYLIPGDQKIIAVELGIENPGIVSRVKTGKARSARIWNKIIERVMQRKKEHDQFMKAMKQASLNAPHP